MASKRQTQANQKNAQLSTGPTTPEGKAVCAANAITHGFSAQATLLPSESSVEFHAFLDALQDEFQPQTALERSLVRHLADADWRLRRAATFEAAVLLQRFERVRQFTEKHPDKLPENPGLDQIWILGEALIHDAAGSDPLSKISRHETRLARRYFKSLAQLRKIRKERNTTESNRNGAPCPVPPSPVPAVGIPAANPLSPSPTHPQSPPPAKNSPGAPEPKNSKTDKTDPIPQSRQAT